VDCAALHPPYKPKDLNMSIHSTVPQWVILLACLDAPAELAQERAEPSPFQGNWQVMSAVYPRSGAQPEAEAKLFTVEVTADTITFRKSGRIYGSPLSYMVIPSTTPQQLELTYTGGPQPGLKRTAIIERDGDTLRLAPVRFGEPAPKNFEADGKSTILVMKRAPETEGR
jgi:uncharacterized protein (TIGR03067 family)